MFTDSHCHLASYKYKANEVGEIVSRASKAGITRQITLATGVNDLDDNLRLAEKYDSIYACLGIHPCDVTGSPDNGTTLVAERLPHPKVAAIGESGLDYYHPAPDGWSEQDYYERQRHFLDQHFQLALKQDLNICLHTRDRSGETSFLDCLEIYEKYADKVRAVFHCFPGTANQAQKVIALGGIVSFTGNVTFKNAKQIQQTASTLPLGSFMLETDAPYMAPVPHRGKKNEPAHVAEVAQYIAELKGVSLNELSEATEDVVNSFFKFSDQ